ncbi:uncharacterized protein LOC143787781 isoform X2 [Ranitomeya variabilis]|uniref:uncharacterized protein LOC143787781 isoform X2 n=1 Tax=Ranitomeya variabilis TaxID=490064 RepID=UPI004056EA10
MEIGGEEQAKATNQSDLEACGYVARDFYDGPLYLLLGAVIDKWKTMNGDNHNQRPLADSFIRLLFLKAMNVLEICEVSPRQTAQGRNALSDWD